MRQYYKREKWHHMKKLFLAELDTPVHLTINGAGSDESTDYPVRLISYGAGSDFKRIYSSCIFE